MTAKFDTDLQSGFHFRPCYNGRKAPRRHIEARELPQVARFHVSTPCMLLVGLCKLKMKALLPFEMAVC